MRWAAAWRKTTPDERSAHFPGTTASGDPVGYGVGSSLRAPEPQASAVASAEDSGKEQASHSEPNPSSSRVTLAKPIEQYVSQLASGFRREHGLQDRGIGDRRRLGRHQAPDDVVRNMPQSSRKARGYCLLLPGPLFGLPRSGCCCRDPCRARRRLRELPHDAAAIPRQRPQCVHRSLDRAASDRQARGS